MKTYDPNSICIKCGSTYTVDAYHSGFRSAYFEYLPNQQTGRLQAELDATQHEREHILRTCKCGYRWREAPLTPMEPIPLVYPEEPEKVEPHTSEQLALIDRIIAAAERIVWRKT